MGFMPLRGQCFTLSGFHVTSLGGECYFMLRFCFCFCLFDRLDIALDGVNACALDELNVMPRWPQMYTLDGFYVYVLRWTHCYAPDGLNYLNVTPQMGSMLYPWLVS